MSSVPNDFFYRDLIVVRAINFSSHCEHNLTPTTGAVHIGYLPGPRLLGIGSIHQVVITLAKVPNIQERLTAQIANAIYNMADAYVCSVMVVIDAKHYCTSCVEGINLRTSFVAGEMTESLRQELLRCL